MQANNHLVTIATIPTMSCDSRVHPLSARCTQAKHTPLSASDTCTLITHNILLCSSMIDNPGYIKATRK